MKRKKRKMSVSEKILKVIIKHPKDTKEIRRELKDKFGYNEKSKDIGINLLYLLRRGKIQRKKEQKIYQYHI